MEMFTLRGMPALLPRLLLVVLLACHLGWLLSHFAPAYSSPDASGYFVQARLISELGTTELKATSPLQYLGVPWLETGDGTFHSRYPPGFPLLLSVFHKTLGPAVALLVNPVLATLSLLLLFLFARLIIGEWGALACTLLFSSIPIANRQALHADAHTATTALLLAGLWLLMCWRTSPGKFRVLVAGLALGTLPAFRYPEGVALAGPFLFLFLSTGAGRSPRSHLAFGVLGMSLPVMALLLYNHLTFGSVAQTGYALTNEQTAFSINALLEHLLPYSQSLITEALGPWLVVGVAGMIWMATRGQEQRVGLLLCGIAIPLCALYMAYYWGAPGDATNRFFIPAFPLFLVSGFWLLRELERRFISSRTAVLSGRIILSFAIVGQAVLGVSGSERRLAVEELGASRGLVVVRWLQENAPAGSVVIADRSIQGTLDYFGRWHLVDAHLLPGNSRRASVRTSNPNLRFLANETAPGEPSPHQHMKGAGLRAHYEGKSDSKKAAIALRDMEKWAGGGNLFWIGTDRDVRDFERLAGQPGTFRLLGTVELPAPGQFLPDLLEAQSTERKLPYWIARPPLFIYQMN